MPLVSVRAAGAVIVAVAGFLVPNRAEGQQPLPETLWICWYNGDTTVHRRLRQPAPDSDAAEAQVAIARPARGARPLPPLVREIIRASEGLLGTEIMITLFTEPETHAFAEQLARATMCFGKPACRVSYDPAPRTVTLLD